MYAKDKSPTILFGRPTTHGVGKVYKTVSRIRMYALTDSGLDGMNIEPETHMLLVHKSYARGTGQNHATIFTRYKFLLNDRLYIVKVPALGPGRENISLWFVPVGILRDSE